MSQTMFEDWIIGVFGVVVMAFFIGCTSCWQFFTDKSADPGRRRQPPPPPSPDQDCRYQHDLYPPNPPPDVAAQHPKKPRENNADSEEDFEEIQDLKAAQESDGIEHNSVTSEKDTGDEEQDYENVPSAALSGPALREDHVYLKILENIPETDMTTVVQEKEENKTPRSAINSIGKYSSQSDSLCHSYENVAVEGSPTGSSLDYVNVTTSPV
ncbi:uncharacterized protein LOC122944891 isoform X2 [Bufo gargarizans]|uniref:uncharacterized protein LOC122944891 isoform X2 n=1 Tax=Bufo gargarizans TaxID=30331 RepID=UPI001CF1E9F2|nr:uncharacterized protein LOC122944891 isoform X2 [Bufo gargarizans]